MLFDIACIFGILITFIVIQYIYAARKANNIKKSIWTTYSICSETFFYKMKEWNKLKSIILNSMQQACNRTYVHSHQYNQINLNHCHIHFFSVSLPFTFQDWLSLCKNSHKCQMLRFSFWQKKIRSNRSKEYNVARYLIKHPITSAFSVPYESPDNAS